VLSSAGAIGFKGSRKGTPYAAQQASLAAAGVARDQYGMKSVEVRVKGRLRPRVRGTRAGRRGLHIVVIRDVTPIPHNGCRPPKRSESEVDVAQRRFAVLQKKWLATKIFKG